MTTPLRLSLDSLQRNKMLKCRRDIILQSHVTSADMQATYHCEKQRRSEFVRYSIRRVNRVDDVDLGFSTTLVLVIDVKKHGKLFFFPRRGIGCMIHIDEVRIFDDDMMRSDRTRKYVESRDSTMCLTWTTRHLIARRSRDIQKLSDMFFKYKEQLVIQLQSSRSDNSSRKTAIM